MLELKKNKRVNLKKPLESSSLIFELIDTYCRVLRLSRATRTEYRNQLLFEIGL